MAVSGWVASLVLAGRIVAQFAVLSETKILIRPYRVPAREGIQSPSVTAHAFAYVTDRRNLDESSLR